MSNPNPPQLVGIHSGRLKLFLYGRLAHDGFQADREQMKHALKTFFVVLIKILSRYVESPRTMIEVLAILTAAIKEAQQQFPSEPFSEEDDPPKGEYPI